MYKYDPTTESVDDALARLQSHDTIEPEPLEEHIITPPSSTHTKHVHNRKRKRKTRSKRRHTLSEDTVINLSNIQLSNAEMKLLSRGLTFVPTPQRIQWSEVQADMNDFARRLRLKEFFHDNNTTTATNAHPFTCKGSWTPPSGREAALDAFINVVEQDLMTSQPTRIHDNLTKHERKALKQLQKRTDIVVKPADKGSGTVVLDYNWYVNECLRQLNDNKFYERQTKDLTNKIARMTT